LILWGSAQIDENVAKFHGISRKIRHFHKISSSVITIANSARYEKYVDRPNFRISVLVTVSLVVHSKRSRIPQFCEL